MLDKIVSSSNNLKNTNPDLAVLLIDMQPNFINTFYMSEARMLWNSQKEVIRHCANNNILLVDIDFSPDSSIYNHMLSKELPKELSQVKNLIKYTKRNSNAFELPDDNNIYLKDILLSRGIDKLFLMGIYASVCVLNSAEGAVDTFSVSTAGTVIADDHVTQKAYRNIADGSKDAKIYRGLFAEEEFFEKPYSSYANHSDFLKDRFVKRNVDYYDSHNEFIELLKNK
jgi:nicotinamidase-related amidase